MPALPALLGLSPLGGGDQHVEMHQLIRRLQGRGGYTEDEDSSRDRELLAWAELAGLARQRLDALASNLLPHKAVELLDAWEQYLRVPNNAPRTEKERRERLIRFHNLTWAASTGNLTAFVQALAPTAVLHTPTRATVLAHDASPETINHFVVQLSNSDYEDPKIRTLFDLLVRVLPQRAVGQMSRPNETEEQVVTTVGPTWGQAVELDKTALLNTDDTTHDATRSPARLRDYGPLSRLTAEDLNDMQEAFAISGNPGSGGSASEPDAVCRFFAMELPSGISTAIDDSVDWHDRVGTLYCQVSALDIRPGEASATSANDAANAHVVPFYTRQGSSGLTPQPGDAQIGSTGVYVRALSTTALALRNDTGSARYVVGCVVCSGKTGEY